MPKIIDRRPNSIGSVQSTGVPIDRFVSPPDHVSFVSSTAASPDSSPDSGSMHARDMAQMTCGNKEMVGKEKRSFPCAVSLLYPRVPNTGSSSLASIHREGDGDGSTWSPAPGLGS